METQPEQANSAATQSKEANSASSPANKHICDVPTTTPKIKNPGRVAAGKKLAELNKQAREAKKQQEQNASAPKSKTEGLEPGTPKEEKLDSNNLTYYILGFGGLIVSGLGVYYQRKAILNAIGRNRQQTPTPAPVPPVKKGPSCAKKTAAFGRWNKINLIYIYIRHHV